jgi:hypothetical protein
MNLLRAELLKIRTTSTWWIFGIILLPLWAVTIFFNWGTANFTAGLDADQAGTGLQADQVRAAGEAINIAANLYTSGQFFGLLVIMLFSAILVTNEFFHLTATTTFLVTPVRQNVILAKLGVSVLIALVVWLGLTLLNLIAAPLLLSQLKVGVHLGDGAVWRAIGLNALAFALWAILGVGAGVLIRSQIATTITLTVAYLVGSALASGAIQLLALRFGDWIAKLEVIVPTSASKLMISGTELPGNPPRWVGAAVLVAYAMIMGLIGTAITRRRDIS